LIRMRGNYGKFYLVHLHYMKLCLLLALSMCLAVIKATCQPAKKDTCLCSYSYRLGGLDNDEKIERSGNVVISIKIDSSGFLGHPVIDSSLSPDCDEAVLKMANSMIVQLNACYRKGCVNRLQPNTTMHQVISFKKDEDE
jgi:hypothetical protein